VSTPPRAAEARLSPRWDNGRAGAKVRETLAEDRPREGDIRVSDPAQVVTEFISTINDGPEGFAKAVRRWFTSETVWENVGMSTTAGPDQALGMMQAMGASGIASIRIENLAMAVQGDKVLTERIDYMLDEAGATRMEVRCMGVFEVDAEGKIRRWADYFDTSPFRQGA
jgi:limonene-1,2-epoxide hydrolase